MLDSNSSGSAMGAVDGGRGGFLPRSTGRFVFLLCWFTVASITLLFAPVVGPDCLAAQEQAPAAELFEHPVWIPFQGTITPLTEQAFYRKLDQARQQGADLIVVEIDSPGGFLDSSLNLAHRLAELEGVVTVAYVPREALSGGAIMALGCDRIMMAPRARIGDAGPIFQGEDALFRHAPEKLRSSLALQLRELADAKGHPAALAEAMVDMELVVYHYRHQTSGEERLMSEHEQQNLADAESWERLKAVPESRAGYFLTLSGSRAVELGLAQGSAESAEELQKQFRTTEPWQTLRSTSVDTVVTILNLPVVTGLLLLIGLVALYVEFSAPGIGLGSLLAGLCFALFFWSRFLGGTAGWLEVILFLAGASFLALELLVIPGFGLPGLLGILLMLTSLLMASQTFVIPSTPREVSTLMTSLAVVVGAGLSFVLLAVLFSQVFGVIPVLSWFVLEPPQAHATEDDAISGQDKERRGKQGLASQSIYQVQVGEWGVAASPLRPAGCVRFADQYVDVVTDGSFVPAGEQVRVIEVRGNRVVVREIESPSDPDRCHPAATA